MDTGSKLTLAIGSSDLQVRLRNEIFIRRMESYKAPIFDSFIRTEARLANRIAEVAYQEWSEE